MRIVFSLLLAFILACGFTLPAQESKALSVVPPDGFQFVGTWDCEGAFRSAKVHKATFTGTTILGDKWLELAEQDLQPATGYLAKYLIGYDSQQKHLVEFDANNFGAAVYTSEQGWQDHVLTMTSPVSEDVTRSRKSQDRLQGVKSQASAFRFRIDRHRSDTALFDQLAENRGENRGQ